MQTYEIFLPLIELLEDKYYNMRGKALQAKMVKKS